MLLHLPGTLSSGVNGCSAGWARGQGPHPHREEKKPSVCLCFMNVPRLFSFSLRTIAWGSQYILDRLVCYGQLEVGCVSWVWVRSSHWNPSSGGTRELICFTYLGACEESSLLSVQAPLLSECGENRRASLRPESSPHRRKCAKPGRLSLSLQALGLIHCPAPPDTQAHYLQHWIPASPCNDGRKTHRGCKGHREEPS